MGSKVKGFRSSELIKAKLRQGAAVAGVLHAGPSQERVEIVTAIHEPSSDFRTVAKALGGGKVGGPN